MAASPDMVAVVAMARNRVIGDGSGLIWHLPADLKRVRALTMGCPLIMGRRTWDSIGRALPGRASVVMTRDSGWAAEGALRAADLDHALALSRDWIAATDGARDEIILFGGGEIYAAGLPLCARVEATVIEISPDGGPNAATFPPLEAAEWDREILEEVPAEGDVPAYRYERFTRIAPVTV
ncbi:MAG: dihydrofolate reductase [Pseudomonadota bacterium]|nr:dihydrofolate reductase [Pseudomonadota bacterium]MEC8673668.1 dihydrofolate reductase [Pseudomonadota bacterium]